MALLWYTVYCKPRKETQVAEYLKAQDFDIYYPLVRSDNANHPYFPRYLFVRANVNIVGMSTLRWIPGSVGLVEFGGEPAIVPDHFIEQLKQHISAVQKAGGLHLHKLKQGDLVEIKDGAFSGYEAVFDHYLRAEDRVQLLLHWLGREMKVNVDAGSVRKLRRRRNRED